MERAIKQYFIGNAMQSAVARWYSKYLAGTTIKRGAVDSGYEIFIIQRFNELEDKVYNNDFLSDSSPAVKYYKSKIAEQLRSLRGVNIQSLLNPLMQCITRFDTATDFRVELTDQKPVSTKMFVFCTLDGKPFKHTLDLALTERELLGIDKDQGITVILRYRAIPQQGNHWGFPRRHFDFLYRELGIRYEGFASSLNSRMKRYPNCGYCCLFGKEEQAFGGMDDFFKIDLLEHEGNWGINPPFVEDVIFRVIDTIKDAFSRCRDQGKRLTVVLYLPDWQDVNELIHQIPEYVTDHTFINGDVDNEFVLEDHEGNVVPGRFNCCYTLFACGYGMSEIIELRKKFVRSLDSLRP